MTHRQDEIEAAPATVAEDVADSGAHFADQGSLEWEEAWYGLRCWIVGRQLGDGSDIEQTAAHGETWQYMGSSSRLHTFRHRAHPKTGERVYAIIPRRSSPTEAERFLAAAVEMLVALRAVNEAGRMSVQSRARYCAEIAKTAIDKVVASGPLGKED